MNCCHDVELNFTGKPHIRESSVNKMTKSSDTSEPKTFQSILLINIPTPFETDADEETKTAYQNGVIKTVKMNSIP